jgi:hypothetical protein
MIERRCQLLERVESKSGGSGCEAGGQSPRAASPRTDFKGLKFDPGPNRAAGEKMTKQALKVVMMLVLIVSLAFLTAVVSANA